MTGLTFRGTVRRVTDKDENEIDGEEQPRHDDTDEPCLL